MITIKDIILGGLRWCFPGLPGASILMYHSVSDNREFFTVSAEMFDQQMKYLKDHGYQVVFLTSLLKKIRAKETFKNLVCLTFDDGYKDNLDKVLPILQKYNLPASIFIATNYIGKDFKTNSGNFLEILNLDDITLMTKTQLIEFLPHTHNHHNLDSLLFDEAKVEVDVSRKFLEDISGERSAILAYPRGKFTDEIVNYLRFSGWDGAVAVKEGLIHLSTNIFLLPRNSIDSTTSMIQFKAKLSKAIQIYVSLKTWLKL